MKNAVKMLGVIALAAIIGFSFTACGGGGGSGGGDDDDDLPPAGNGFLGANVNITNQTVYDFTIEYTGSDMDFLSYGGHEGSEKISKYYFSDIAKTPSEWEVKIVNNKLSVKMGAPKDQYFKNAADIYPGTKVTNGLKIFTAFNFYEDEDDYELYWAEYGDSVLTKVHFVYANNDGKVSGEFIDKYESLIFCNLDLKQGWNTVLFESFSFGLGFEETGKPDSSFKWIIEN